MPRLEEQQQQQQQQPTIAITGATGNCGQPAVRTLLERGMSTPIRVISRSQENARKIFNNNKMIDFKECSNCNDEECLRKSLRGIRTLAINPPSIENRADIVCRMIDAAKKEGIKHIVLISVPHAEQEQITFQKQFNQMEQHLKKSGMNYTILRCMFFMENFLRAIQGAKKETNEKGEIILKQLLTEKGHMPMISSLDIGRCEAKILENPENHKNVTYSLTGPESYTAKSIAQMLGQAMDRSVQYKNVSPEEFKTQMQKSNTMEPWMTQGIIELMDLFERSKMTPSNDFKKIVGTEPTSFPDLLRMHQNELRA